MVLGDSHASQYYWVENFGKNKVEDHSVYGCIHFSILIKSTPKGKRLLQGENEYSLNQFIKDSKFSTLILSNMGPSILTRRLSK